MNVILPTPVSLLGLCLSKRVISMQKSIISLIERDALLIDDTLKLLIC